MPTCKNSMPIGLGLGILVFSKRYQKKHVRRFFDRSRQNIEIVQDAIEMQQEIQSFDLVEDKRREVHAAIDEAEKIHMSSELGQGIPVTSATAFVKFAIPTTVLAIAWLLIRDEISASLDVENEMAIQESLNQLIQNKTVVIISHRMKSIERVNKIVVFEDGRINAVGRHDQLMQSSDLYRRLVEKSTLTDRYVY